MLKQSPSRNQKSKGFKVKHAIQTCLLLAICIWLLYQVKHSHERKKASEENSSKLSEKKMQSGHEIIKLGRKELHPREEETERKEELEQVIEEIKPEESEDEGMGGGDDEMDGHQQGRVEEEESEEADDLIDEEDREREGGSEELDGEGNGNQIEDLSFFEDEAQIEVQRDTQEAREENYKGDDASSAVVQNTRTISTEIGGLRKVKEQEIEDTEKSEVEQDNETSGTLEVKVNIKDSRSEASNREKVENVAFGDALHGEKGSKSGLANSEIGSNSFISLKEENIEQKVHGDSTLRLMQTPGSWNGTDRFNESIQVMDSTSSAINKEMSVLSGSKSVALKGTAKIDASSSSDERAASKTTKESEGTVDRKTEEGSESQAEDENEDAAQNESFDSF
ncbi:midasin-like [Carya illinoinensis]|nr:midasin-like [Carya illinoinensis]XP_042989591.1 midasin-like [Carya illinoinensis]XP_042989592.1 midasin-like [Carya illinoinensis]KAG6649271.1 hypothetical protein CIPAW_07G201100 [Carya illinoinensis]KAG6649272.1 hypothetical protein CIPAW_07G201100 [Carya illinoinensis]KAG6649273.1 hypothetical protein CIPAW_07G201100 [Carya illinoinensis]KAG6649274.1 hypothetical protein CIPAW_07G201100 [Carya illinoinensis]KAG6705958.1 hypothetical protein I3842_07G203700 [Carya illinoinensis]